MTAGIIITVKKFTVQTSIPGTYPESGIVGLFINVPIHDAGGRYIGVTGGGVDSTIFSGLLEKLENDWNIEVYLVRNDGRLVYASNRSLLKLPGKTADEIWGGPVIDKLSREKGNPDGIIIEPDGESGAVIWGGYMPEWESYLIVERSADAVRSANRDVFLASVVGSGFLALSLIILNMLILKFFIMPDRRAVDSGRDFVKRMQSLIYLQNRLLDEAGAVTSEELSSLKLMTSAGPRMTQGKPVSVHELLNEVLIKKRLTPISRLSARKCIAVGNDFLIKLLLEDLLDTAVKWASEDSSIVILTRNTPGFITLDIAFQTSSPVAEPDVSILNPVADVAGAEVSLSEPSSEKIVIQLKFQLSGE